MKVEGNNTLAICKYLQPSVIGRVRMAEKFHLTNCTSTHKIHRLVKMEGTGSEGHNTLAKCESLPSVIRRVKTAEKFNFTTCTSTHKTRRLVKVEGTGSER